MIKFTFDHFPREEEIIDDVEAALLIQCKYGCIDEISEKIKMHFKENLEKQEKDTEDLSILFKDFEKDTSALEIFSSIFSKEKYIKDISEKERDEIALLWVNYMCNEKRGKILGYVRKILLHKTDYKKQAIEIVKHEILSSDDDGGYYGSIIYIWTLMRVVNIASLDLKNHFRKNDYGHISMN